MDNQAMQNILSDLKANGFMQQKQEGFFSMRLHSVGGHFTVEQLGAIQKVAEQFGKGYIHLTSRQGIEIPFIHFKDIDAVKKTLAEGNARVGVCGARVRTITACQGNAVCASGLIDTARIANEIEKRVGGRNLPHKFKIGLTGCRNNCLKAEENDLGIKGAVVPNWKSSFCIFCGKCVAKCPVHAIKIDRKNKTWEIDREVCVNCGRCIRACESNAIDGEYGFSLSFGGRYGNQIRIGQKFPSIVFGEENLFEIIERTLKFFETHGKKKERFSSTLERIGWEIFKQEITK